MSYQALYYMLLGALVGPIVGELVRPIVLRARWRGRG